MGSIWKHDILDILLLNCSWVDNLHILHMWLIHIS